VQKRRSNRPRRYTQGPHVFERNGRWWAYLPPREPGQQPVRCSLSTTDRREAERKLGELLAGRRDPGGAEGPAREASLADVVRQYLNAPHGWTKRSEESIEARATAWLNWCAARNITHASQIAGADARQWVADRLAAPCSHATVNRDLGVVRRLLRWGAHQDRGLCVETPFARLPQLREDRRERAPLVPSPREVGAVVTVIALRGHERPPVARGRKQPARPRTRPDRTIDIRAEARMAALYVACSLGTGVRISELMGLELDQLHAGAWIVPPGKGHAERTIPLSPESERALHELVGLLSTVKSRNGRPLKITERWALDLLAWACPAAGIERFCPHDLRRTFATECRRAGLPITVIRDLMGHKSTTTTEGYIGRYREDAAAVVPVPAALRDLVTDAPANVVPMRRR
jgi:integrase